MSSKVIKVSEETYNELVRRASWSDTLDAVIRRLIQKSEEEEQESQAVAAAQQGA